MAWIYLFVAGLLEVAWAVGMKYSQGFTKLVPSVITGALMIASFFCLTQAVKTLSLGTSYAIWTGIGVAGTAILGVMLFNEPAHWVRFVCIGLILAGIAGLKITAVATE
jgi:quaternary ammonium compound-resistance protein SugE